MEGYTLIKLREDRSWEDRGAAWYHGKWGVPLRAYQESVSACLRREGAVPQWYLVLDRDGAVAAGAGVIENDFHDRPDLRPNLCALYVEEPHRGKGLARWLLNAVRADMGALGESRLYLVTDHTQFYEKCGWTFLTAVRDTGNGHLFRLYTAETLRPLFKRGKIVYNRK